MISKITDDFEKIVAVAKIKRIEIICKKYFTKLQKMKNKQPKIKPKK